MNYKELLSEVEILGALTACSNKKGARCSQCPVFGRGWNRQCRQIVDKAVVKLIENQKKKVENLEYTLIGVMHSIDKWLEGDELTQHEVKRAIRMREKVLQIIEKQQVEIDKLKTETVEALEKQIPKQVKKIRHETILGYAVTVYCPFCGGSVWQNADESKYCFRCGQALKWEVSE